MRDLMKGSKRCTIECWKCEAESPIFTYYIRDEGDLVAYPGKDYPQGWIDDSMGEFSSGREGTCPKCVLGN